MHCQVSDKVCVLIHHFQLLTGIIVVNTNLCVISANHDPLLARHELCTSHWSISNFKGPNLSLLIIVEYNNSSGIESDKDPGECGM